MNILNCPACEAGIEQAGKTLMCPECGWHKSFNRRQQMKMQSRVAKGIFIAGLIVSGFIMYVGNWGPFSLSIIPVKVSQWSGQLNEQSFKRLKGICMSLKKYDCVEQAHLSFFQSSGHLDILEQLGEFQYRRKKMEAAYKTYSQYFKSKGKSVKAAYNYARIMEKEGKIQDALSYYKYALKARPDKIQVTVIRSYIDLLVKSGQVRKARRELLRLKPLLERAGSLVQQEYERWRKQVI